MAHAALDANGEWTPADFALQGAFLAAAFIAGCALMDLKLEVDGPFFDTDDGVHHCRQQRNTHDFGLRTGRHAFLIDEGLLIIKLYRNGFAIFNTDA